MIRCRTIFSPLKSSFRNCSVVGTTTINDVPTNVNIHEHKLSRPQKIKNEIKVPVHFRNIFEINMLRAESCEND